MKRILLLTTGGTIASRPTGEGLAPEMDGAGLLARLGGAAAGYELTIRDLLAAHRPGGVRRPDRF